MTDLKPKCVICKNEVSEHGGGKEVTDFMGKYYICKSKKCEAEFFTRDLLVLLIKHFGPTRVASYCHQPLNTVNQWSCGRTPKNSNTRRKVFRELVMLYQQEKDNA